MSDFTNTGNEVGTFLGNILNPILGTTTTSTTTTQGGASGPGGTAPTATNSKTIIIVIVAVLIIGVGAFLLFKPKKTNT